MTLSEAAVFFKQFAKFSILGIIVLTFLWMLVNLIFSTYQRLNPEVEPATVLFGKIPKPNLPSSTTNFSFVLDTIDGRLPLLPKIMAVYPFAEATSSLLDRDRAIALANKFGFKNGQATSSEEYRFTHPQSPAQEMRINIVTKNFSIKTLNYLDASIAKSPPPESTEEIAAAARNILSSRNLLPADTVNSPASVTYLKIDGSTLLPAISISESNFARVDIFREGVAGYPIVGPKEKEALISLVLAAGKQEQTSLVEINYNYAQYFIDGSSTYPILSAEASFEALKQGEAYLATQTSANFREVRIKNISLGYFESSIAQKYLQPIFLFDGVGIDGGPEVPVRFYLPAVDPAYFSN